MLTNAQRIVLVSLAALLGMVILAPVILVALPLWLVSFLLRRCYLIAAKSQPWEAIIDFNKHIGWEPKANLDVYCSFAPGSFRVRTDQHGWRGKEDLTRCDAVVLGDSFAFGFGVDDDDAFFSLKESGLRIKAIGSPGYNMVQELLWLEKYAAQLRGKLVVWFICLGNDLYDNLRPNMQNYRTPFARRIDGGDWEIVTDHVRPEAWHYNAEHDFHQTRSARAEGTFSDSFLSSRAYSACEYLVGRANDLGQEAGLRLAIVSIPTMSQLRPDTWTHWASTMGDPKLFDARLPDRRLQEICQKVGVNFTPGSNYLEYSDYILEDGHWNKKGHQKIANLLREIYFEHGSRNGTSVSIKPSLQFSVQSKVNSTSV